MLVARRAFLTPALAVALVVVDGHLSVSRDDLNRPGETSTPAPQFGWDLDGKPIVVYFDFDDAGLSNEARQQLSRQLSSIKGLQASSMAVIGHTDRVGNEDYNFGLAARRAETVANTFEICGLRPQVTTVTQQGEAAPAIETRDGVAEPRNRRVEVTLSLAPLDAQDQARHRPSEEKTFVVSFALDETRLVGDAKQQLAEMSAYAMGVDGGQVVISGHADRSGKEDYNQDLSRRRADEVADAIMACGFDFDDVDVTHEGEQRPVVDTRDGVQEPRNRRVEITIKPV